jgi:negative regulator of sigma E activity
MMGRRVREWPRLVAAVAVAAVALVLIGVVVASASSGGTKTVSARQTAVVTPAPAPAPAPKAAAPKPAASNADKQRIANLQAQIKRQSTELTTTRHELATSIARTHCWRNKASDPAKQRTLHCPTGSLTR